MKMFVGPTRMFPFVPLWLSMGLAKWQRGKKARLHMNIEQQLKPEKIDQPDQLSSADAIDLKLS